MKKRFIVMLDQGGTSEQNTKFKDYCGDNGLNWWFWLKSSWLLVDKNGIHSADAVRNAAKNFFPGNHCLVIEFSDEGDTWSGFGPSKGNRNMFKWIRNNW